MSALVPPYTLNDSAIDNDIQVSCSICLYLAVVCQFVVKYKLCNLVPRYD